MAVFALLPAVTLVGLGGGLIVHGCSSLIRHECIGLPGLGPAAATGRAAVRTGWELIAKGLAVGVASALILRRLLRFLREEELGK